MRADDLVVLLEIARCGSLVGAASALELNHATVSRRVSALEAELRAPVLVRNVKGCEPTELGYRLLESCEKIESALTEVSALAAAGPQDRALSGLVRIATTYAFGSYFVAPLLARLHRENPELTVEIVTSTRLTPYNTGWDIEIGVGDPVASRPGAEKLTDYALGLYAHVDYLAERGMPGDVDDLADHSLIYYVESLLRVQDLDVLEHLVHKHRVRVGSTSVHAQLAATLAGGGIGLLPAFMAEKEPELRRVLWPQVSFTLAFSVCLAPRRLRRPAATPVLQAIRALVAEHSAELVPQVA
ncbi:LysR family transcriptional regulator [Tomitella gaofuii]|uniref:LysR family transcriptional regulator n=1 Tax=Tomitella gaofuii TaxID=2760083 RepID=UPI0015F9E3C1|nr:LysR family transcriptional regulator [Tomitella gaofuii]